jgi:hypothetical protein
MSTMSRLYATALPDVLNSDDFQYEDIEYLIATHEKLLEDVSIGVICNLFKELINKQQEYMYIPIDEELKDYFYQYFYIYITALCDEYIFGDIFEECYYKMGFDLIAYYLANSQLDLDETMSNLYNVLINKNVLYTFPSLKREIPSGVVLDLIDQLTFYTGSQQHSYDAKMKILNNILDPIEYFVENEFESFDFAMEDLIICLLGNLGKYEESDLTILRILNRITLKHTDLDPFLQLRIVLYDYITEHNCEIRTYAISILHRVYINYHRYLSPISIVFLFENLIKHTDRMAIHLINILILDKHKYTMKLWRENNMNSFVREHPVKCMKLLLNKNTFESLKDRAYSVSIFRGDTLPWFLEEKHSGEIFISVA